MSAVRMAAYHQVEIKATISTLFKAFRKVGKHYFYSTQFAKLFKLMLVGGVFKRSNSGAQIINFRYCHTLIEAEDMHRNIVYPAVPTVVLQNSYTQLFNK